MEACRCFESKGLMVSLSETKMIVGRLQGEAMSKRDQFGICSKKKDANSVLCFTCGR